MARHGGLRCATAWFGFTMKGSEHLFMLNNYDELVYKSVSYPAAIVLDDLADDFARLDCKDNVATAEKLLTLLERLSNADKEIHRRVYELLEGYGFKKLLPQH